jgi:hypothetical protein
LIFDFSNTIFPLGYICEPNMDSSDSATIDRAAKAALTFGTIIRSRRKALNMRQDELALATGVGRRFLIDLEAGKPSCQLGRSLLVAEALGLRPAEGPDPGGPSQTAATPELPELPDLPAEM